MVKPRQNFNGMAKRCFGQEVSLVINTSMREMAYGICTETKLREPMMKVEPDSKPSWSLLFPHGLKGFERRYLPCSIKEEYLALQAAKSFVKMATTADGED
jgi:hypothetical protein